MLGSPDLAPVKPLPAIALAAFLAPGGALGETGDERLRTFCRNVIRLDEAQIVAVEKGEVVTKQMPSSDRSDVAAFGVVRTAGDPDRLVRLARDVVKLRKVAEVPELGIFGSPPTVADLAGLSWPPEDLAALRECKPGRCDVKLTSRALDVLGRVDWAAAGADERAAAILDQMIADHAAAYEAGGTDALGDAIDKKTARSRAREYRMLLEQSPYLVEYVQELHAYLASYPNGRLEGAHDVLYWTKDTFGPKPVVSGYHQTTLRRAQGALVATRLLAASHFFNAGLEIMAGVPTADGRGLYLAVLYRVRLDPPTGLFAGALMGKVKGGVEAGVRQTLERTAERLADME